MQTREFEIPGVGKFVVVRQSGFSFNEKLPGSCERFVTEAQSDAVLKSALTWDGVPEDVITVLDGSKCGVRVRCLRRHSGAISDVGEVPHWGGAYCVVYPMEKTSSEGAAK